MSRRSAALVGLTALFRCAVLLLPRTSVTAADTKPGISHEALYLMKRVGGPAPSPDGKWVAL